MQGQSETLMVWGIISLDDVQSHLEVKKIKRINWSPQSLNMNLIESVWILELTNVKIAREICKNKKTLERSIYKENGS